MEDNSQMHLKAAVEVDAVSILQQAMASDSHSDIDNPCRTVDEILNESDYDSSSGESPTFLHFSLPQNHLLTREDELMEKISAKTEVYGSPPHIPVDSTEAPTTVNVALPDMKNDLYRPRHLTDISGSSFTLGRSSFPQFFGGGKTNPKPGAALAAAIAASRSIQSPYAAAIKLRRGVTASMQKIGLDQEEDPSVCEFDGQKLTQPETLSDDSRPSSAGSGDRFSENSDEFELTEQEGERVTHVDFSDSVDIKEKVSDARDTDNVQEESSLTQEYNMAGSSSPCSDAVIAHNIIPPPAPEPVCTVSGTIGREPVNSVPFDDNSCEVDVNSEIGKDTHSPTGVADLTDVYSTEHDLSVNELYKDRADVNIAGDVDISNIDTDLVENIRGPVDNHASRSRKEKKKLRSSIRPLELAEELEKKYASSGLHLEEGAAAQPMRLEGIQRGPPAVGHLQIDTNNIISRTISAQSFRRDYGTPQVLAVHSSFIAVGMSKGIIVVVSSKYSANCPDTMDPKMTMLGLQSEKSPSSVTSMCFNQQGDFILAGYGNGHLTVWDVQRATAVKTITSEHTAPVVHTLFLWQDSQVTRQFKAVTGDCKGLVLLHMFSVVPLLNRVSIKTQCLLDGQRTGTVLSASPLVMDGSFGNGPTTGQANSTIATSGLGGMVGGVVGGDAGWKLFSEGSSLVEEGVVIFVTYQTALVVRLTPTVDVYAHLSRPEGVREGSLPYTAWNCGVHLQSSLNDRVSLLAIAWDHKIQVAQLVGTELKVFWEWSVDSAAIGIVWLDYEMLVVVTSRGQLSLFEKEGSEIHRTSFAEHISPGDDMITYHAHFINIFGNPEKAYHNSVAVRGATLYLLGPYHLVILRLLPWKERIQALQKAGDWMGALDMALRLYDGHAHGVVDIPRTVDAIRGTIMPDLVELLLSYVDEVFSYISVAFNNQAGNIEGSDNLTIRAASYHSEIEEQYARVGGVAVEFSIHITRMDVLFNDIFSRFVAVEQGGTFLELLEPYILKDMLGCLPPEIMQALVEHYNRRGWLQRVEQCVLHMDISSLDFNQVVKLCREHGLYGALIYLFNRGLDDFKAPLEELLTVVQDSKRLDATAVGYRMLIYLKYCFQGLAFPPGQGRLPPPRVALLRVELIHFLLEDANAVRSKEAANGSKPCSRDYPKLCYLLWLDTEATLEVIKYAFPGWESSKDDQQSLEESEETNAYVTENQQLLVQNVVNTIIQILPITNPELSSADTNGSRRIWPSKSDLGCLLEFISCFVSCRSATIPQDVLEHILEYLISEADKIGTRERERQVLSLLSVVDWPDWDSSNLLQLCEKAQFYQVCGFLYTIRGQYVTALDNYMKDINEPVHTYAYINAKMLELKDNELATFRAAVVARIHELVNLSREGTIFLVLDHFSEESHQIVSDLRAYPRGLFFYLKTIIEIHLSGGLDFSSLKKGHDLDSPWGMKTNSISSELTLYFDRISDFQKIASHNVVQVTDEVAELYLELLCQFERNSVLKFLEVFENYHLEHCLRLCQEYEVTDAAAFLLERAGDVGSALSLLMSGLSSKLLVLDTILESKIRTSEEIDLFNNSLITEEVRNVQDTLHACIGLCQRNSSRLDPLESEALWFRLLDSFSEPLNDLYEDKRKFFEERSDGISLTTSKVQGIEARARLWKISLSKNGINVLQGMFSHFIREIFDAMVGYVSLPKIMSKLLSDSGSHEFGDLKLTILGMMGTYDFERRILDTAKSLIEDDTFYTLSLLRKEASHAYAPKKFVCCLCGGFLIGETYMANVRLYSCGHAVHFQCEPWETRATNRETSIGCPICVKKKNDQQSRSRFVLVDDEPVKNRFLRGQDQGIPLGAMHCDSVLLEKPYVLPQLSRYEILAKLGNAGSAFHTDALPHLRLAPPALYHDKVTMTARAGSFNRVSKDRKSDKMKQGSEVRASVESAR